MGNFKDILFLMSLWYLRIVSVCFFLITICLGFEFWYFFILTIPMGACSLYFWIVKVI